MKKQEHSKCSIFEVSVPKSTCCNPELSFRDGTGYRNLYQHLLQCFARGKSKSEQESVIRSIYDEAKRAAKKRGGLVFSRFKIRMLPEYERAVSAYLRLIIRHLLPLSIMESQELRELSKYSTTISTRIIMDTIIKLVELVEKRVQEDLSGTRGALFYDGWTSKSNMNYVALVASYSTDTFVRKNGTETKESVSRLTLLALSPVVCISSAYQQATRFNAETNIYFMNEAFKLYDMNFKEWALCLVSDNASTNKRVSFLTSIPHAGCCSHKLNLEVRERLRVHGELRNALESVRNTMIVAKSRLKNTSILRNLTDLRLIIPYDARWSGKSNILQRFVRIRSEFIEASDDQKGNISINQNTRFHSRTQRCTGMLKEIDCVTKALEERG